jgi:hypothetical protein
MPQPSAEKKQGASWRPASTGENYSLARPTYFGVEPEVVAAASVFGFLLWCFFWVAGLVADASAAGAAAGLAGAAAAAGVAAGAAVVAAEANIGATDNAATAAATII